MKQSLFVTTLLIVSLGIGYVLWIFALPDFLSAAGPLVSVLIALSIMLAVYITERIITLRRARGSTSIQSFCRTVLPLVQSGDLEGALAACERQRGSLANVIRASVERYQQVRGDTTYSSERRLAETQRAIEAANAEEAPRLDRNLIALSTIASIATMVGLLGTTFGMIRAFAAAGHMQGGVAAANALATGISEALVNTAGGLFNAIVGIVAYNYFLNKVDGFSRSIDEATYEVLHLIKSREATM